MVQEIRNILEEDLTTYLLFLRRDYDCNCDRFKKLE